MRKKRVILCDDDRVLLKMMAYFFTMRGDYDVLAYEEPTICPVSADETTCPNEHPCADIMLVDIVMPAMNGIDLLRAQSRKGCKIPIRRKALVSGHLNSVRAKDIIDLHCAFFEKPVDFEKISEWLYKCEQELDLSQPLGITRKETRFNCFEEEMQIVPRSNEQLKGMAINTSQSGLCLMMKAPLNREETVVINPAHINTPRSASVRWIKKIPGGFHMAGLKYL